MCSMKTRLQGIVSDFKICKSEGFGFWFVIMATMFYQDSMRQTLFITSALMQIRQRNITIGENVPVLFMNIFQRVCLLTNTTKKNSFLKSWKVMI